MNLCFQQGNKKSRKSLQGAVGTQGDVFPQYPSQQWFKTTR